MTKPCPCGLSERYEACCQPYHRHDAPAPTPEALMRSRYSAFALGLNDYLLASWHPDTRPGELTLSNSPQWVSLQILGTETNGNRGSVNFRAIYRTTNGWGYLEEESAFIQEGGRWYYHSGNPHEGTLKPGRNEPCPCGSGKKFKACCL